MQPDASGMPEAGMFLNRVAKNARHWGKWARRRGTACYRVYDRDIPEFPFALDVYAQRAHLQEYRREQAIDTAAHAAWLANVRRAAAEALGLPLQDVVLKQRRLRQAGEQHEKTGSSGEDFVVTESGHRFLVNLEAYLDTGLFLDHRNTRAMVGARARGKRLLNLFCYTGSFSVYAAAGGAASSLSVDMSNTYLDWARRNFELNGLDLRRHRLLRADVVAFLRDAVKQEQRYDLIVLDPPSFSSSKKMQGVFDVQRDHVELIKNCLALLAPQGELFFSTNLRGFRLDADALAACRAEEISQISVPEDFRNQKIHRCWLIRPG